MRSEYFSTRKPVTWEEVAQVTHRQPRSDIDIENLRRVTGDAPNDSMPKLRQNTLFNKLIDRLRNAFAHCCFEPYSDESRNIKGVRVWNVPDERDRHKLGQRRWQAEISEPQLRGIAFLFIAYLEAIHGSEMPQTA